MWNVRSFIEKMKPYFVLQNSDHGKLNQNESPIDIAPEIKQEILSAFEKEAWQRYPKFYPESLVGAISNLTGHPAEGILVGAGSSEILQVVLHALCDPHDKIAQVAPTFPLYPLIANILALQMDDILLDDNFQFNVESIIQGAQDRKLVLLASPNNPTGTVIEIEDVEKILASIPGILVLDEAYFEFYGKTAQLLLDKYDNLLIVRTFSKALGFAGIRIGYLLGHPDLVYEIGKVKLPYTVNTFQQVAGTIVLKYHDRLIQTVEDIKQERDRVLNKLQQIPGIEPVPSETNFLLLKIVKKPAGEVAEALAKRDILVRYAGTPAMKDYFRMTIGSREENEFFIENLKELLS